MISKKTTWLRVVTRPIQDLAAQNTMKYFDDELNKKKSFSKRGLVAMANKGPNMNSSGFFVTLGELDQGNANLHKRHTIFG